MSHSWPRAYLWRSMYSRDKLVFTLAPFGTLFAAQLQDSNLKNVQHRLAQNTHKKMKAKEAANKGEGGEE